MGKHSRRAQTGEETGVPGGPLAEYELRRRPPNGQIRRHRPLHGGAIHVDLQAPRVFENWDGFVYAPAGTAEDLAAAEHWVNQTS
jgi:hypothetical protein